MIIPKEKDALFETMAHMQAPETGCNLQAHGIRFHISVVVCREESESKDPEAISLRRVSALQKGYGGVLIRSS